MRRRFLFFCSVFVLCMFSAHDSFATVIQVWKWPENYDFDEYGLEYNEISMCENKFASCLGEYGDWSRNNNPCHHIDSRSLYIGCYDGIRESRPSYIAKYYDSDTACYDMEQIYRVYSCTSCPMINNNVRLMSLSSLCYASWDWKDIDNSGSVKTIVSWMGNCVESVIQDSDLKVCVECVPTYSYTNWGVRGYKATRNKTTVLCGETQPGEIEYACAANAYRYSGSGENIDCRACPANAICNKQNGHTSSFQCNSSFTKNSAGTACVLICNTGQYSNGSDDCLPCPAGTYQPNSSNTGGVETCLSCAAGTYQPNTSAASCLYCAVGTYQPNVGAASCLPCAVGTYQPNTGATSCLSCATGTYQPNTGATSCLTCPAYLSGVNEVVGLTNSEATELKTQCYINAGEEREYSDASGDYVIEGDPENKCYYSEPVDDETSPDEDDGD